MENLEYLEELFSRVDISNEPEDLNISGTSINRCTDNAKLIVANNQDIVIGYVEGIMMILDEGRYRAVSHAWNFIGDIHFDITRKLFQEVRPDLKADWIGYFPCRVTPLENIPIQLDNVTPFTDSFIPIVKFMNDKYPVK